MRAVLVVDVEEHGDYYVDVYRKDADDRFEGRYYLKPLPHSKQMENRWFSDDYSKGWNDCLDEITGETE